MQAGPQMDWDILRAFILSRCREQRESHQIVLSPVADPGPIRCVEWQLPPQSELPHRSSVIMKISSLTSRCHAHGP